MDPTPARSSRAKKAHALVQSLQGRFVAGLEAVARGMGATGGFEPVVWLRDGGRHGGGLRYEIGGTSVFDRGSVNVSQVHYDDEPQRRLGSATALSAIIHPRNPHAPSVHLHFSWTQMREGSGYWRLMADLNPSIPVEADRVAFEQVLRQAAPSLFERAAEQGARYFYIPALGRHRGVSHFYLEGYDTGEHERDAELVQHVATSCIAMYCEILERALRKRMQVSEDDRAQQLAYHTLYLFQVLTLDRGTTSGLMVHDQNDVGILGSLPSHVDRRLLSSWESRMAPPQDELLRSIVDVLPDTHPASITVEIKAELASVLRQHYRKHPAALDLQASADIVPPTVDNHR